MWPSTGEKQSSDEKGPLKTSEIKIIHLQIEREGTFQGTIEEKTKRHLKTQRHFLMSRL